MAIIMHFVMIMGTLPQETETTLAENYQMTHTFNIPMANYSPEEKSYNHYIANGY